MAAISIFDSNTVINCTSLKSSFDALPFNENRIQNAHPFEDNGASSHPPLRQLRHKKNDPAAEGYRWKQMYGVAQSYSSQVIRSPLYRH